MENLVNLYVLRMWLIKSILTIFIKMRIANLCKNFDIFFSDNLISQSLPGYC